MLKAVENLTEYDSAAYIDHLDFKDKPFKFMCPQEQNEQTFKTELIEHGYPRISLMLRNDENELPYSFDNKPRKLDFKVHVQGVCQSCKTKIDFLIRSTSDKDWNKRQEGMTITLQKIGQFPFYEIGLNTALRKYLSDEDQSNYKRLWFACPQVTVLAHTPICEGS